MSNLKRAVFEAALATGKTVQVTLIAVPGLDIPKDARVDGVVLDYGLDLLKPIHDLEEEADGIRATLSFSQVPVKTFVPWAAIVRLHVPGDLLALWPIDVQAMLPKAERPKLGLVD